MHTADPAEALDPGLVDSLIDRLARLEAGMRQELAAQMERAERAETALASAQAGAATASIAARTEVPSVGAERVLSAARQKAARIVAEAQRDSAATRSWSGGSIATAFREVLIELRHHLMDRQALDAEVLAIAREAINGLGSPGRKTSASPIPDVVVPGPSPDWRALTHQGRMGLQQRNQHRGEDEG